jgi:hypothetical protein
VLKRRPDILGDVRQKSLFWSKLTGLVKPDTYLTKPEQVWPNLSGLVKKVF